MKIIKLKATKTQQSTFDFKAFSDELRELSETYGVKLMSVGAFNGLNAGANGMNYLAVWSEESGE